MRPIAGFAAVVSLVSSSAYAAGPESAGGPLVSSPVPIAAPAAQLSAEEMEAATGGQGISVDVLTRQQLSASTSGNTISAGTMTSGDVSFDANSLDGFNGVGNFVVNTGANNTLQGAINISIVTTPAS